jgi:predicted nucleic acid-binding protein
MLVDTSFLVALMRESNRGMMGPATKKLKTLGAMPLAIPLFALCELEAGARASSRPLEQRRKLDAITAVHPVVYPTRGFAAKYADISDHLRLTGAPIPLMDVLIAALARCVDEPLLTGDRKHFSGVPDLVVESF